MNWYVAYTQPQKELLALHNLRNQGLHAYLPRYSKTRRHARRTDTVLTPLFPLYMFVKMDAAQQRWRAINGTLGIAYLLSDGEFPLVLSSAAIDAIKNRESNGIVTISPPNFEKGQKVRIIDGPLAELEGCFECVDDQERVVLLMDLLGRAVRTRVEARTVTAA